VYAKLVITHRDAPGAKKFAVKLQLFVWITAALNPQVRTSALIISAPAESGCARRNGLARVDQHLRFT